MSDYEVKTHEYVKHGLTLFQSRLLADTEQGHIAAYAEMLRPSGLVVDMGAGIGAMGVGLQARCPEISAVVNVTNSAVQAEYMRDAGSLVYERDYHSIPEVLDGTADFVMFNESLGYGDLPRLLAEASRMLRAGGRVALYEFLPLNPAEQIHEPDWKYTVYPADVLLKVAAECQLRCTALLEPSVSDNMWQLFLSRAKVGKTRSVEQFAATKALFVFQKVLA
jgi:SAM-dependent methyltransferase